MRIDVAYCSELDRIVDIDEACLEFIAQDSANAKPFTFLCSDPICRERKKNYGVPVSAINYTKLPTGSLRRPHYRGYYDKHIPECMWIQLDIILAEQYLSVQSNNTGKIHRLFNRFIIPKDIANYAQNQDYIEQIVRIINDKHESSRKKKLSEYVREVSATATSLDSLVNCYEELKATDKLDQELAIKGGKLSNYKTTFRQIKNKKVENDFHVYYGGAKLNNSAYGSGLTFTFYDKIQEMPIRFNVPSEHLKNNRFGSRLRRIIDELEINKRNISYVKIYWIGDLEKTENGFNATFKNLAHVVFRIVYRKIKN